MKTINTIFSAIIFSGIFALHPSLNKGDNPITSLQHYVYGNSLNISTNSSIDKNQLEIKWICKVPNDTCQNLIIFKNGKQLNEIPSKKGNQMLLVYYNNKVIGELPQNKNSKNQAHQYRIELLSKDNSLFFKGDIYGPSSYIGASTTFASL